MTPKEQATAIILATYQQLPKWDISTRFIAVEMSECQVYTPVSGIKKGLEHKFRDQLQMLYLMTQI